MVDALSVGRARLLVVDDGADNRRLLKAFLSSGGYQVDLAEDGRVAVERTRAASYDLILLDLSMPVLDGFGAARAIRADDLERRRIKTPIVAVTAFDHEGVREQCLDAGMDDYMPKPIDRSALLACVRRHLGLASGPSSEPPAGASHG